MGYRLRPVGPASGRWRLPPSPTELERSASRWRRNLFWGLAPHLSTYITPLERSHRLPTSLGRLPPRDESRVDPYGWPSEQTRISPDVSLFTNRLSILRVCYCGCESPFLARSGPN